MKTCFKCGHTKPVDDFYRHAQMGDGHLNKCKACTKCDVARYRRTHRESVAEYERERFSLAARKAQADRQRDRFRAVYPEKYRAHNAVGQAMRDGSLVREACEVCGAPETDAHHDDYSRPLSVRWLCRRHHHDVHLALKGARMSDTLPF